MLDAGVGHRGNLSRPSGCDARTARCGDRGGQAMHAGGSLLQPRADLLVLVADDLQRAQIGHHSEAWVRAVRRALRSRPFGPPSAFPQSPGCDVSSCV